MKITLILLAFVAGLLIGEYRGCPKDKYSMEYGCSSKSTLRRYRYSEEILCEACICVRERDYSIETDNEYEGLDLYARNIG